VEAIGAAITGASAARRGRMKVRCENIVCGYQRMGVELICDFEEEVNAVMDLLLMAKVAYIPENEKGMRLPLTSGDSDSKP
jgi:hypothetical protein